MNRSPMSTKAVDQHRRWLFIQIRTGGALGKYGDRLIYSLAEARAIFESKVYEWLD